MYGQNLYDLKNQKCRGKRKEHFFEASILKLFGKHNLCLYSIIIFDSELSMTDFLLLHHFIFDEGQSNSRIIHHIHEYPFVCAVKIKKLTICQV